MKNKAFAIATALVLAGTLPLAADAGKPVKPVLDNAAAYPVLVDTNGTVVGPIIYGVYDYVVVRLNGYTLQLGITGTYTDINDPDSYDRSKVDWYRGTFFFEQFGCVGTAYAYHDFNHDFLGFSGGAKVFRDLVSQRDTVLIFPPANQSTLLQITARSYAWDGQCYDIPEPGLRQVFPVTTKIDISSIYSPPFTLK